MGASSKLKYEMESLKEELSVRMRMEQDLRRGFEERTYILQQNVQQVRELENILSQREKEIEELTVENSRANETLNTVEESYKRLEKEHLARGEESERLKYESKLLKLKVQNIEDNWSKNLNFMKEKNDSHEKVEKENLFLREEIDKQKLQLTKELHELRLENGAIKNQLKMNSDKLNSAEQLRRRVELQNQKTIKGLDVEVDSYKTLLTNMEKIKGNKAEFFEFVEKHFKELKKEKELQEENENLKQHLLQVREDYAGLQKNSKLMEIDMKHLKKLGKVATDFMNASNSLRNREVEDYKSKSERFANDKFLLESEISRLLQSLQNEREKQRYSEERYEEALKANEEQKAQFEKESGAFRAFMNGDSAKATRVLRDREDKLDAQTKELEKLKKSLKKKENECTTWKEKYEQATTDRPEETELLHLKPWLNREAVLKWFDELCLALNIRGLLNKEAQEDDNSPELFARLSVRVNSILNFEVVRHLVTV
jgi:myosin heavy subunit